MSLRPTQPDVLDQIKRLSKRVRQLELHRGEAATPPPITWTPIAFSPISTWSPSVKDADRPPSFGLAPAGDLLHFSGRLRTIPDGTASDIGFINPLNAGARRYMMIQGQIEDDWQQQFLGMLEIYFAGIDIRCESAAAGAGVIIWPLDGISVRWN